MFLPAILIPAYTSYSLAFLMMYSAYKLNKQGDNIQHCHCYSITQSCPTLCNPMDCNTPGFAILHYLSEFAQTHVHWVSDAIQPSHPLSSPSPPPSVFPSIKVFSNKSVLASPGQSTRVSASASVLPMNIQDWVPLGWTGWISLLSKGFSKGKTTALIIQTLLVM